MAKRKVPLIDDEYFHIYNRGNAKNIIFLDDQDYERFTQLLYICNSDKNFTYRDNITQLGISAWDYDRGDPLLSIGAWVLMPNHFHIYLISKGKGNSIDQVAGENLRTNISIFMEKLGKAYAQYFNEKYKRTGSLFEGKFKAVHIVNDTQAKYLFSYIHLNPLKLIQKDWKEKGVKNKKVALEFLNTYKWGSYLDYVGITRRENIILDRTNFINYFPKKIDFKKEIFEWINFNEDVFVKQKNR